VVLWKEHQDNAPQTSAVCDTAQTSDQMPRTLRRKFFPSYPQGSSLSLSFPPSPVIPNLIGNPVQRRGMDSCLRRN